MNAPHPATLPQYLLLEDVPWDTYEKMSDALSDRSVRVTYDRGALEIMVISHPHDWVKKLLARMIERLAEELQQPIKSAGSTTQRRKKVQRGLEPDESYYLASEPLVRFKNELDFDRDPPPDLVVEVDITSSALDRMGMYAAMKVPELWRYDHVSDEVLFYLLDEDGTYARVERSKAFPLLSADTLTGFLRRRHSESEMDVIRAFVEWVRKQPLGAARRKDRRNGRRPKRR